MRAVGEVIEINGDNALVKFKRAKACKNCQACASFSETELLVELKNTLDAHVGDRVGVSLHEKSVFKASLIAYGIPLAALIAGVFAGSFFGDVYAAIAGIAGVLIAFAVIKLLEPRMERMKALQPKMTDFIYSDENNA